MVRVLVGGIGCVLRPTGHSLVTLLSLSISVKDCPLLQMIVRSQTYYPEHILTYGSRKARYAFVMDSGSFRIDFQGCILGGGLSTILRPGLRCWGLGVQVCMGPRPFGRSGKGWSCLCLGYKRGVCFEVPSQDTLTHKSPFPLRRYDLTMVQHHSKNWNMEGGKMVLFAQPLLEGRTGAYLEWLANKVIMTANKT